MIGHGLPRLYMQIFEPQIHANIHTTKKKAPYSYTWCIVHLLCYCRSSTSFRSGYCPPVKIIFNLVFWRVDNVILNPFIDSRAMTFNPFHKYITPKYEQYMPHLRFTCTLDVVCRRFLVMRPIGWTAILLVSAFLLLANDHRMDLVGRMYSTVAVKELWSIFLPSYMVSSGNIYPRTCYTVSD